MGQTVGIVLCLLAAWVAVPPSPSVKFTDAATLLDAVAKTYAADATTFHFESITETTRNGELDRSWQRSIHTVIKAPGNRFRFEARTSIGTWMQDSDGTTEWVYLREAKMYVKHPAENGPQFPKVSGMGTMELKRAWDMRTFLDADAEHAKNAALSPDETISIAGRRYPCYVVHATTDGSGLHSDETF